MIGAIAGDIIGSRFEFDNILTKDFELFTDRCSFTDDSVLTAAVADAILHCGGDYGALESAVVGSLRRIGRLYPDCGYGGLFRQWLYAEEPAPYRSFGNGAAMRVSPAGFAAASMAEAVELSRKVTAVTHDHPEGLRGAEATAAAIVLARQGRDKEEIRREIHRRYYPLDFTLDGIRGSYSFSEACQETVPQAITAFLESTDFEDAVRNAVSIGGDSDTLAAIAGGIAEAYYGVPEAIRARALCFLDGRLAAIVARFQARFPSVQGMTGPG